MSRKNYYIKRRRGIYRIAHKLTGMCYIGQSVDIVSRWRVHATPNKSCIGKAISAEPDAFTFEILEECSKEMLNEREIYWIEHFQSIHPLGYNKTSGGGSSTEMSEDTKKKMSKALKGKKHTEEHKLNLSESLKGKTHSEETKQKISESRIGKSRSAFSEEHRQKLSDAAKAREARRRLVKS